MQSINGLREWTLKEFYRQRLINCPFPLLSNNTVTTAPASCDLQVNPFKLLNQILSVWL